MTQWINPGDIYEVSWPGAILPSKNGYFLVIEAKTKTTALSSTGSATFVRYVNLQNVEYSASDTKFDSQLHFEMFFKFVVRSLP